MCSRARTSIVEGGDGGGHVGAPRLRVALRASVRLERVRVVHSEQSTCHATSGRGDSSARIPDGRVTVPDHLLLSRRGHLLSSEGGRSASRSCTCFRPSRPLSFERAGFLVL